MRPPVAVDPRVGHGVRYYRNGWRWGLLTVINDQLATIRPASMYNLKVVRPVHVPLDDVDFEQTILQ